MQVDSSVRKVPDLEKNLFFFWYCGICSFFIFIFFGFRYYETSGSAHVFILILFMSAHKRTCLRHPNSFVKSSEMEFQKNALIIFPIHSMHIHSSCSILHILHDVHDVWVKVLLPQQLFFFQLEL